MDCEQNKIAIRPIPVYLFILLSSLELFRRFHCIHDALCVFSRLDSFYYYLYPALVTLALYIVHQLLHKTKTLLDTSTTSCRYDERSSDSTSLPSPPLARRENCSGKYHQGLLTISE